MVICPQCNQANLDNANYCSRCGQKLRVILQTQEDIPQQVVTQSAQDSSKATIALILGIVSLFFLIVAPIGVVFGVMGLKSKSKGMAITGLILSIIGCVEILIVMVMFMFFGDNF
jgi:cytochrome c biogenesis protein CcdA